MSGETKWQVWVSQGAEPVILQAHIEYGARKTRPTHHMVFTNLKLGEAIDATALAPAAAAPAAAPVATPAAAAPSGR